MPNASPKRSRLNIVALGDIHVWFALGMLIACCLFPFLPALLPNKNAVSGVMWALDQSRISLYFRNKTAMTVLSDIQHFINSTPLPSDRT